MDKESNSKKMGRMLKKRYIIALSIIAFLVIFSQVIIQYTIAKQQDDSRVVNISGRQRMLSQRINKDVFGLYISSDTTDQKRYLEELSYSLDLWEKSHNGLQNGDVELGLPGQNSEKITEMFQSINDEYKQIVEAARSIQSLSSIPDYDKQALLSQIHIIQKNETVFLKGMDAIVFQYDEESKRKIAVIKLTEIMILFVTFFTLSMEILFIFRPAQKQIEKSLEEIEIGRDNMEKLFETAPSALVLIDEANFRVMKLNHLAQEVFHSSQEDPSAIDIKNMLELNQGDVSELVKELMSGAAIDNLEVVVDIANQKSLVMLLSSNIIRYDDKRTILLGLSDITKLKEAEEVLKRYATIDEMTGLLNKRSGMLVLSNIFEYARERNEEFCVSFIDLDGLKQVNDVYGHEEGDLYIKTVSQAIRNNINGNDSAFRYGGDEIVLILLNCDFNNAKKMVERIQESMRMRASELAKPYYMHFSYGIVDLSGSLAETPEELLTLADQEMYKDKQKNRLK